MPPRAFPSRPAVHPGDRGPAEAGDSDLVAQRQQWRDALDQGEQAYQRDCAAAAATRAPLEARARECREQLARAEAALSQARSHGAGLGVAWERRRVQLESSLLETCSLAIAPAIVELAERWERERHYPVGDFTVWSRWLDAIKAAIRALEALRLEPLSEPEVARRIQALLAGIPSLQEEPS